jgi:predicted N-formylglutamate amidohydrolase
LLSYSGGMAQIRLARDKRRINEREIQPMTSRPPALVLTPADTPPFTSVRGPNGDFLVVCDHASALVPRRLNALGLPAEVFKLHIAVDLGALWAAQRIAERLNCSLIAAGYSRLVVDCNRYPWYASSVPLESDRVSIPGNIGLSREARAARLREIFVPYQVAVADALDTLMDRGARPVLLSIHSCTAVLNGQSRPWNIGVSYTEPGHLARQLVEALRLNPNVYVGDNLPYAAELGDDYTTCEHASRRGLEYLQVEFRQDLIATMNDAHVWADHYVNAVMAIPHPRSAPIWTPYWPAPHRNEDVMGLLEWPSAL